MLDELDNTEEVPAENTGQSTKSIPASHFNPGEEQLDRYANNAQYGDPACTLCHGSGRVKGVNPPHYKGPSPLRMCRCVLVRKLKENVERGMAGLSSARRIKNSTLIRKTNTNLRITADEAWTAAQLRYVAFRNPFNWDFRVVTDAELVQAWLATAAAQGHEIFDTDARMEGPPRSLRYMTLDDIAGSAHLLIIRLGVKTAPNKEMPNVLLEALRIRQHEGLPTWLWDQHENPLVMGHRCWSDMLDEYLCSWDKVTGSEEELEDAQPQIQTVARKKPKAVKLPPAPMLEPTEEDTTPQKYDPSSALLSLGSKKNTYKKKGFR